MKKTGILLALLALFMNANAQENGEDEWGAWYMYFGMNRISERFSIHSEAQFRYYETTSNFNQLLLRTGLNYHINPNAIATGGYAFIKTDASFEEPTGASDSREHRIFQQFILKNKVWEFLFEHRYRLEQRFLSSKDFLSDPESTNTTTEHRARYRIQMTLPLTDIFFLNFYDELFINLQDELFGQNRLYGALGVQVTENSSVQFGYLRNQFTNAVFDRIQIGVFYNPDLRGILKKKKKDE